MIHERDIFNKPDCAFPKLPDGIYYPIVVGSMGKEVFHFPSDFLCDGVVWEFVTINGTETLRVTDSATEQFEQYKQRKELWKKQQL